MSAVEPMELVDVVDDLDRAQVLLHPTRLELLAHLAEPSSAATLARRLGLPRQRVNYHLRELEAHKLVQVVEERRKGSVTERVVRRTGRAYAISTAALGSLGIRPLELQDRFSSAYQIALASQAVRELGLLRAAAREAGKALATFALEVEVRFASPALRHAFAEELATAVAELTSKYHAEAAPEGRTFRFYLGGYPQPAETNAAEEAAGGAEASRAPTS